jgi:uncharacterized protein (TIGR04168 family)
MVGESLLTKILDYSVDIYWLTRIVNMKNNKPFRIAIIGDIHLEYDEKDTDYFNESNYDLLLFVGDLSGLRKPSLSISVAKELSNLEKPAVIIPGNHDVHNVLQIIAEVLNNPFLVWLVGLPHKRFHVKLLSQLEPVVLGGYSLHPFRTNGINVDIISARPYAMGGSSLSYSPLLKRLYGVRTMEDSVELLQQKIDESESENLIFLAHNGPWGLGENPTDIWGCDFDPERGDFGDRDLTEAVQYANTLGKRVLAVIAGHMHLQTYLGPKPVWRRGIPGPERSIMVEKEGIVYVNSARVPRKYQQGSNFIRHHLCFEFDGIDVEVREKFIEDPG